MAKKQKKRKQGLWDNIHAKRARIKAGSGEKMAKGKKRPTAKAFRQAAKTAKGRSSMSKKRKNT